MTAIGARSYRGSMSILGKFKGLLRDLGTLYFVSRDSRLSMSAKAVAIAVVVYTISPIDVLPDMLPALGILDDLLVIPAGLFVVRQLVPVAALDEHRARAERLLARVSTIAIALVIVGIWIAGTVGVAIYLRG